MLDIEKIRQLIEMMVANDLVEVSLRDGEEEVNLRRPTAGPAGAGGACGVGSPVNHAMPAGVLPLGGSSTGVGETALLDEKLVEIRSPMVGTFYAGPDPESPPFVSVGSAVSPSTVVCILEAMKVFNEIKSEVAGSIERVLAKNGQPVEYGQPLFLVRPI